ncbi:MAG: acetyltransferase [Candidatus Electrothrix sp. AR3]|nr:acetyltransferase [Candidatus Electrothrix sp. AR3]
MSKKIIIVTAGGFGREVHYLIEEINNEASDKWSIQGYVDDDKKMEGQIINGLPVIGTIESLQKINKKTAVVIAAGKPAVRRKILQKIASNKKLYYPNLIHPTITLMPSNTIGRGNIICKGTIITVNVNIDDLNIINLNCTIGHDVRIGKFCTLAPNINLSGCSHVGDYTELGTNVIVIPGVSIGTNSIIGAGAVVTKDIQSSVLAVGMPAKEVKKIN